MFFDPMKQQKQIAKVVHIIMTQFIDDLYPTANDSGLVQLLDLWSSRSRLTITLPKGGCS